MIRIDALWLALEPVDMRAGADRLHACVVQVFGAARAHHGYLFANARVFANARATRSKLLVHDGFGVSAGSLPALTPAQFDALVVGLPWQRLAHMQTITHV
jgi:transposase